jgi:amidase
MAETRISAFCDDALADHDAVGIAELIRTGKVSREEVAAAAVERIRRVDPILHAVVHEAFDRPRVSGDPDAPLYGVPTFVKDNTDVAGMPSNHGSAAFVGRPAHRDGRYTPQYLSTGMTVLGKSRLPEFGFNATTEFEDAEPTRNPWHTDYSVGASSGGSAALVASGAVPIAHANDGGGSIRIPAAAAGLVGLKPSRGRHVPGDQSRLLPIDILSEGVLTRTVRDTAAFLAAAENHWRNPRLAPIGLVQGPSRRRLRIGMILETATGSEICPQTRAAVEHTATLLEEQGHSVEPMRLPVDARFAEDFTLYWGLLATMTALAGKSAFDKSFDASKLDGLTRGLREHYRRSLRGTPAALYRLRRSSRAYAGMFRRHEVVLSPVVGHVAPKIGHLSPNVPYPELMRRLLEYVAYTPLNNVTGSPAISLPMAMSEEGVPIGVQLSAAHGDERTLMETAFALEEQQAFPRIAE